MYRFALSTAKGRTFIMVSFLLFPVCPALEWGSHFALASTNYFTTSDQALLWIDMLFWIGICVLAIESTALLTISRFTWFYCLLIASFKWSNDFIVSMHSFTITNWAREMRCRKESVERRTHYNEPAIWITACFSNVDFRWIRMSTNLRSSHRTSVSHHIEVSLTISKFFFPSKTWSHHVHGKRAQTID
jgi:hypothetical protein